MEEKLVKIIDKKSIIQSLSFPEKDINFELGCGSRKRDLNSIGIDIDDSDAVDIVGDALQVLKKVPDNAVSKITSYHFLEHVDNLEILLEEIARVLKQDGTLVSVVPHFSNPFFYSDPTHKNFFGLYTFFYYASGNFFSRQLPQYRMIDDLEVQDVVLIFKSFRPHYVRHGMKKIIGFLVNSTPFAKEFYEENLCWLFPCYEIHCTIVKKAK